MTRDTLDMFRNEDRGRFGDNESESIRGNDSVRSDLIDLMLVCHAQTPKALLVSSDGDESKAKWIPKSQCEHEFKLAASNYVRGKPGVAVTMPRWLAEEKGLV